MIHEELTAFKFHRTPPLCLADRYGSIDGTHQFLESKSVISAGPSGLKA